MEIERINENTVKFYISYVDIESRGFEREEIWYNRERSEQLFWQMMDEVNYKEDFPVEGPLWIQVQALEKGLEIVVTKAQISNEHALETLEDVEDLIDLTLTDQANNDLFNELNELTKEEDDTEEDMVVSFVTKFDQFDNVIELSHYFQQTYEDRIETRLYHYKDAYFLFIKMNATLYELQEDLLSQILEFSSEAEITKHVLEEYGKVIIEEQVFKTIRHYFT
ncbi:MAG TPA: adaptor protein MecA [Pseudogracilibacillus sp.]|nr:adaptor protein MecA [Pseudogracilibacillus sp.]